MEVRDMEPMDIEVKGTEVRVKDITGITMSIEAGMNGVTIHITNRNNERSGKNLKEIWIKGVNGS